MVPFGMLMGHSGEEFWEALDGENALLRVVTSCGFTSSQNGVRAIFAFPVFSVSSPRGRSLGFRRTVGGGTRMLSGCPQSCCGCAGPLPRTQKGLL